MENNISYIRTTTKSQVDTLILEDINFMLKLVRKENHYILIKRKIQQEEVTHTSIYALNARGCIFKNKYP